MKNIPRSFPRITRFGLQCIAIGLLAPGIFSSHARAGDAPTPAPVPKTAPLLSTSPSLDTTSGTSLSGSASTGVLGGISASAGDTGTSATVGPGLVARIGDVDIKTDYVRELISGLDPAEQEAMAANPAMLKKVVFSMLVEQIVTKEISARQWDDQPAVQAHLARVRQTTLADMFLKSISIPPKEYPSPAELQTAYDARKEAFIVPHQFMIQQIFIALPMAADKATTDRARNKLDAIIKSFHQPHPDFTAIAREQSDDPKGAEQGGSMGWVDESKMPPRIRAQAMTLPLNKVSEPIRLDDGLHIIRVIDSKDPAPLALEEVKDKLVQQLRLERTQANMQAYVNKLLELNPITIDDKALPSVLVKPAKPEKSDKPDKTDKPAKTGK